MSETDQASQIDSSAADSKADAISAIVVILTIVSIMVYWVSHQ